MIGGNARTEECVCREECRMDGIFGLASVARRFYLDEKSFSERFYFSLSVTRDLTSGGAARH